MELFTPEINCVFSEKKNKKVENLKKGTAKWGFLHRYDAQERFWFDVLAMYMEFYSSGFSKVQQKQATKQHVLTEPQEPFSELTA